jgi:hypothetical protein
VQRFLLVLVLTVSGLSVGARPHRTHSVHRYHHSFYFVTGDNTFQVESYFGFENKPPQFTTAFPSLFLRYGIIDRLEVNLLADVSSIYDQSLFSERRGIAPLQPGFKLMFNNPKLYVPAFALIASVVIPKAATEKMKQTYWAPTLLLDAEQDITRKLSFEYAGGVQWDADNFQRIYIASLNAEYDFNPRTSIYSDFFMIKPSRENADLHADIGVNQYVAPKVHFDLSAGIGLTYASTQYYFQGGLQFMLPTGKHKGSRTMSNKQR